MKNFYIILILFFSFAIFSCAKKSDTSSTTTTNTEIEGTWKTACHSSGDYYYIRTVAVTGTTFVEKNELHSDSSCANDNATFEVTFGSLSMGDAQTFDSYGSSGGSGAEFTMTVSTNTLTILNSTEVSWANTNSYCGETDWELNVAQDVSGKTCGSSTEWSSGITIYGLYILDGNKFMPSYDEDSYPSSVSSATSNIYYKQ